LLIVINLSTKSAAEKFVSELQLNGLEWINCEIIKIGNASFRVSVASFDDEEEAKKRKKELIEIDPNFVSAWIAQR